LAVEIDRVLGHASYPSLSPLFSLFPLPSSFPLAPSFFFLYGEEKISNSNF